MPSSPSLKEPTDLDPGDAARWGAPDAVHCAKLLKGTHATEAIQPTAIDGEALTITAVQQILAAKTFNSGIFKIRNPGDTFSYTFIAAAIAADRNVTLPLLAGNDTLVTEAFAQTLTNKTISGSSNTISNLLHGTQVNDPSSGVHGVSGNVVGTTDTQTLSGKTLTAPKIVSGGFIADANGNELIIFTTVASAVNELTVVNAATGDPAKIMASGETNVGIRIVPKGTGEVRGNLETVLMPLGDESTVIDSTGVKYTFYMIRAGYFVGAGYAQAVVAPTTSALILDIKLNGTTIFSTKPEVAATANTGSNGVLTTNPTAFAIGDKVELVVDTLDSGGTGAGAKVGVGIYYT